MAKYGTLPPGRAFSLAGDALMAAAVEGVFVGEGAPKVITPRDVRGIVPILDKAYRLGLEHGALADAAERNRIIRRIGTGQK